jgi:hypothetical protein
MATSMTMASAMSFTKVATSIISKNSAQFKYVHSIAALATFLPGIAVLAASIAVMSSIYLQNRLEDWRQRLQYWGSTTTAEMATFIAALQLATSTACQFDVYGSVCKVTALATSIVALHGDVHCVATSTAVMRPSIAALATSI